MKNKEDIIDDILKETGYLGSPRINLLFARRCLEHDREEIGRWIERLLVGWKYKKRYVNQDWVPIEPVKEIIIGELCDENPK